MTARLLTVVGGGMVVFGAAGLLRHADETEPVSWATFFLGALIVHDAVLAPLVIAAGVLLTRVVPRRLRPAVQGGLLVSGALVLIAFAPLTGNGRLANNPSILPLDYGDGLMRALIVVWVLVALLLLVRAALRRMAA